MSLLESPGHKEDLLSLLLLGCSSCCRLSRTLVHVHDVAKRLIHLGHVSSEVASAMPPQPAPEMARTPTSGEPQPSTAWACISKRLAGNPHRVRIRHKTRGHAVVSLSRSRHVVEVLAAVIGAVAAADRL